MSGDKQQAWQALGKELAGTPPQALEALGAAELNDLAGIFRQSHQTQQQQLQASLENALSYAPALLRGTLRKVLFPK